MVGELVVFKQKNNSAKQQFFPGSILCVCMCVSNNNECITASGYNADVCESLHVCVCVTFIKAFSTVQIGQIISGGLQLTDL